MDAGEGPPELEAQEKHGFTALVAYPQTGAVARARQA